MDKTYPQKTNRGYNNKRPGREPSREKERKTTKTHGKGQWRTKLKTSWPQIDKMTKNRMRWRTFVDGLSLSDGYN